jgi:hypothetical protein
MALSAPSPATASYPWNGGIATAETNWLSSVTTHLNSSGVDVRWLGAVPGVDCTALVAAAFTSGVTEIVFSGPGTFRVNLAPPTGATIRGTSGVVLQEATPSLPVVAVASVLSLKNLKIANSHTAILSSGTDLLWDLTCDHVTISACTYGLRVSGLGIVEVDLEHFNCEYCTHALQSDEGSMFADVVLRRNIFSGPINEEGAYYISIGGDAGGITTGLKFDHLTFEGDIETLARVAKIGSAGNYIGTIIWDSCHFPDWRAESSTGLELITSLKAQWVEFRSCDIANRSGHVIYCAPGLGPQQLTIVGGRMVTTRTGHGDCPIIATGVATFVGLGTTLNSGDGSPSLDLGSAPSRTSWLSCSGNVQPV